MKSSPRSFVVGPTIGKRDHCLHAMWPCLNEADRSGALLPRPKTKTRRLSAAARLQTYRDRRNPIRLALKNEPLTELRSGFPSLGPVLRHPRRNGPPRGRRHTSGLGLGGGDGMPERSTLWGQRQFRERPFNGHNLGPKLLHQRFSAGSGEFHELISLHACCQAVPLQGGGHSTSGWSACP